MTEPSIVRGTAVEMSQLCSPLIFAGSAAVFAVSSRQRPEFMHAVVPLRMERLRQAGALQEVASDFSDSLSMMHVGCDGHFDGRMETTQMAMTDDSISLQAPARVQAPARNQIEMMCKSLDQLLPPDHFARVVVALVKNSRSLRVLRQHQGSRRSCRSTARRSRNSHHPDRVGHRRRHRQRSPNRSQMHVALSDQWGIWPINGSAAKSRSIIIWCPTFAVSNPSVWRSPDEGEIVARKSPSRP